MLVKDVAISIDSTLIIEQAALKAAGLGQRVRLIIKEGEIRILPEAPTVPNPEQVLEDLAGCLGQELVENYDFSLKVGGLNEAR
jgi:hypothetical protein